MYMYVYVYVHVCMCVCICVCKYVCQYVCMYVYIYGRIWPTTPRLLSYLPVLCAAVPLIWTLSTAKITIIALSVCRSTLAMPNAKYTNTGSTQTTGIYWPHKTTLLQQVLSHISPTALKIL